MNELKNFGISDSTIERLNVLLSREELDELNKHNKLVSKNINYLKEMGLDNVDVVFSNYPSLFLLDSSKFESIFNKYEAADLVEKINSNVEIIEFL